MSAVSFGDFVLDRDARELRRGGQPVLLVTGNIRHLPEAAFQETRVRPVRPGAVLEDLLTMQPAVADACPAIQQAG